MTVEVRGLEEANRFINRELKKVSVEKTERFIVAALASIEAQTAPFVPVDTSNLINSATRNVEQGMFGYEGSLSYEAEYAVYVHDGGPKNFQKAGAEDLFLQKGAERFIEEDLDNMLGALFR